MARRPVPATTREHRDAGAHPCPGRPPHLALILGRLTQAHRVELAEARALLIVYREFIENHGLTPPDLSGAEALERFRHVFELAGLDDDRQHPELLADWRAA